MFETTDLSSYYPGYDDYCEPSKTVEEYDNSDELHEEMILKEDLAKMNRKTIDLKTEKLTFGEVCNLEKYVWKNDKLIPEEKIKD